jgi:hypothetical protein
MASAFHHPARELIELGEKVSHPCIKELLLAMELEEITLLDNLVPYLLKPAGCTALSTTEV